MQYFCHLCFLGKFGPIIWISSNWLKFRIGVHCDMLVTVLMFIFSKLFSYFLGKFGPKIWRSSNWLKFGTEVDCYMLISILMFIFSNFLSVIFILVLFDESVSLRRNPLKAMVITKILYRESYIMSLVIMSLSCPQPCIPSWNFSKLAFSHLYGKTTKKIDISMVNMKQIVWEPIKYLTIFLFASCEQSSCTLSEEKQNVHIAHSSIQTKKVENYI